ncbi:MAG: ABC transporter permease [Lachnospiraceae bacterium]|jgi:simple sugar transport system permease protein|nr:ABC transporter permease [Lachnospiraceae bacterium]
MQQKKRTLFQLLVILSGLVMALIVILLCSDEPALALRYFFIGPFSSTYFLGDMLNNAVPLIICGLAASISFTASVWNLGLEGMVYFGMLTGTITAAALDGVSAVIAIPLMFLAAFLGGAVLSALCSFLYSKFHLDIMMSSLMLANVIFYLVFLLIEGPLRDADSEQGVTTKAIPEAFRFGKLLSSSDLNTTIFIALALAVFIYFALKHSRLGYEIRMTGLNASFARYGGINTGLIAIIAMLISGGLGGVGGLTYVLGTSFRVRNQLCGIGWSGLSIAMISRNNPALVVPVAIFFAYLTEGAQCAALFADITPDVSQIIQGAILLLVTGEAMINFLENRRGNRKLSVKGVSR